LEIIVTEDINELIRIQRARELAAATLEKAAGRQTRGGRGGTYLTTSFKERDDLPVTASLRKMSDNVVRNLAELGLHEPVSLQMLPGRWWKVHVDAAELGQVREYGCCYVTLFMSSQRLAGMGFEVVDGPYEAWANTDVARAILNENLGKYWDAGISNRPVLPSTKETEPYHGYDDGYTSEALLAALDAGETVKIHSGPFDTADAAHYALDVRWESPE
jgi:hypothetical protein